MFWNRVLFTKQPGITLRLLGKVLSYDFLATSQKHPTDFSSARKRNRFNPYNVLRVGQLDRLLNSAPLFAPDWYADAFSEN